jgi:ribosomal protein S4E
MKEVQTIVKQRLVKIDGHVRTDARFPTGFMDVVQIEKTGENFRIIYDVKGRFIVHRITAQEAKYKLCKVRGVSTVADCVADRNRHFFSIQDPNFSHHGFRIRIKVF